MKRILSLFSLLLIFSTIAWSQAKKPTIMVVPSDSWCNRHGYMQEFTSQGNVQKIPDYSKAFLEDYELRTVISAMSDFMAANDFPLKSLETELSKINTNSAEEAMMTENNSGAVIAESPIDQLRRTARPDIILNLDYKISQMGPRRQVEFNLQAIDAYSSKVISGNTGTSSPVSSSTPMTTILEESVLSFKDNFLNGLQRYFDDLFTNGREISVTLNRYESCPIDFETEFAVDDEDWELAELIEDWFADNTVNGRFSTGSVSANKMQFDQVRIPLYIVKKGKERALDAREFGRMLQKFLKEEPYNLNVSVDGKGLGEVWLTLGGK